MFKALMICALIGMAVAAAVQPHTDTYVEGGHTEVLSRKDDVRADGFDHSLDLSNHIHRDDSGDEHGNQHGSFGWISPEGEHIEISYVADEHGYRATGDAVPKVPEHVVRLLAWNAAHAHDDVAHH